MLELKLQNADSTDHLTTDPTMTISLFQQIIKSLPRRKISDLVAAYDSNNWCKSFSTYAQLTGQMSLRDVEASFNAGPARHYHLGSGGVKRSTFSNASARRPCSVFEAILQILLEDTFGRHERAG